MVTSAQQKAASTDSASDLLFFCSSISRCMFFLNKTKQKHKPWSPASPLPPPCQSSWGVQDVFSNKNGMTCYKYRVNFSLFDLGIKGRSEKWFTASLGSVSWTFLSIATFSARRFCEWEIWSPQNVCESSLLGFIIRMLQCQLWLYTSWALKKKKIQLDPRKKNILVSAGYFTRGEQENAGVYHKHSYLAKEQIIQWPLKGELEVYRDLKN